MGRRAMPEGFQQRSRRMATPVDKEDAKDAIGSHRRVMNWPQQGDRDPLLRREDGLRGRGATK
jgi:hypothetical protein